jgi:DNA-directed RNA polymerase specialized sigma subunit
MLHPDNYHGDVRALLIKAHKHWIIDSRELKVLTEYYLDGKTCAKLAEELEVSRERVWQIKKKALARIKPILL